MIVLTISTGIYTGFEIDDAFTSIPKVIMWIIKNLVPDQKAMTRVPKIIDKLTDTILMSIMASIAASVFSLVFALFGSRTTQFNKGLAAFSRAFASINRNIPIAAWAMIFLVSFGMSSFTGFLALFFASFGFLTRMFIETIDEASASSVEALRAVGASYTQVIAQAVIPASLSQILSWILYMIETNIRSSTLVGILTGTGIGFTFSVYYKSLQYTSAALVVLSIVIVVLAIEILSNMLRRLIL